MFGFFAITLPYKYLLEKDSDSQTLRLVFLDLPFFKQKSGMVMKTNVLNPKKKLHSGKLT